MYASVCSFPLGDAQATCQDTLVTLTEAEPRLPSTLNGNTGPHSVSHSHIWYL